MRPGVSNAYGTPGGPGERKLTGNASPSKGGKRYETLASQKPCCYLTSTPSLHPVGGSHHETPDARRYQRQTETDRTELALPQVEEGRESSSPGRCEGVGPQERPHHRTTRRGKSMYQAEIQHLRGRCLRPGRHTGQSQRKPARAQGLPVQRLPRISPDLHGEPSP